MSTVQGLNISCPLGVIMPLLSPGNIFVAPLKLMVYSVSVQVTWKMQKKEEKSAYDSSLRVTGGGEWLEVAFTFIASPPPQKKK